MPLLDLGDALFELQLLLLYQRGHCIGWLLGALALDSRQVHLFSLIFSPLDLEPGGRIYFLCLGKVPSPLLEQRDKPVLHCLFELDKKLLMVKVRTCRLISNLFTCLH